MKIDRHGRQNDRRQAIEQRTDTSDQGDRCDHNGRRSFRSSRRNPFMFTQCHTTAANLIGDCRRASRAAGFGKLRLGSRDAGQLDRCSRHGSRLYPPFDGMDESNTMTLMRHARMYVGRDAKIQEDSRWPNRDRLITRDRSRDRPTSLTPLNIRTILSTQPSHISFGYNPISK